MRSHNFVTNGILRYMATQPKKMSVSDIKKKMMKLTNWSLNAKQTEISRSITFDSFLSGLAFIAKLTVHAEILGHYPDIELTYSKVKINLSTHEIKGLSSTDFELAKRIDALRTS